MRKAAINKDDPNGVVQNIIQAGPDFVLPGYDLIESADAGVGFRYNRETGEFSPPQPEPQEPKPFTVYKADIWRRCTDDEATQLDAALAQQPVRMRRMFDDAQFLSSGDELFGQIQTAVTQLLGVDRAAVLLAFST